MDLPQKQGLYDPRNEHDSCGVGFVADIKGRKSHAIVRQGLSILVNLDHRGAVGADPLVGDGAGCMIQTPHALLRDWARKAAVDLPPPGHYAVAMCFLPQDEAARKFAVKRLEHFVKVEGQKLLGWRDVPTDTTGLGKAVIERMPVIRMAIVGRSAKLADQDAFERKILAIRKQTQNPLVDLEKKHKLPGLAQLYMPSFSSRTVVYKGLLLAPQVESFYEDLRNPLTELALCLVHQRFSTNTFPSWRLAHPYRFIAHNGEINTVRGNVNWMYARRRTMESDLIGADLDKMWPIIPHGQSDTACVDNALELLVAGGYSLSHAMMMLIPEAWAGNPLMDAKRKAFYEYHAALMEPWDGPACIAFTDGRQIGATLDRNGLRPARFLVTDDDKVVMASESGVLPIPDDKIVRKWRLQPGKMLLIDLEQGRIVEDEELKRSLAEAEPYEEWLKQTQYKLEEMSDLPDAPVPAPSNDPTTLLDRQQAFGYTQEDINFFLEPMSKEPDDPIGSMGTDTPIAVLSRKPKLLYNYFKQNFAQVTNPPIDPIREELVMSLVSMIGPRPNLLGQHAGTHKRLEVAQPVLTNSDLEKIRSIEELLDGAFRTATIDTTWPASEGAAGLEKALDRVCHEATDCVLADRNILILSDRAVSAERVAIPALLATAAVHHHLIRRGLRTQTGLVVESGEVREVHHFCCLAGYGAEAVNPYLAFETLEQLRLQNGLPQKAYEVQKNYIKAVGKGLLKVMSKMGISTYQSYCGAQIFDAVGLHSGFVEKYFTGTATTIEGAGWQEIAEETVRRHRDAYGDNPIYRTMLDAGGDYAFRLRGEDHAWTPDSVARLQHAVRGNSSDEYKAFATTINEQSERLLTIRGLMQFKWADAPIPVEEVEPAADIVKRFATGAMSFGSISREAHTTLAIAMNRIGGKSNTGEGGEESDRFKPLPNGDSMRSAIKQVASGRFGVSAEYLVNADDLQIKMAQGAKPGEGGQLPGHKVDENIARVRRSTAGVGLISPPPHHDIYSIEDLAQLIHDLKNVNPRARVSVKLVSEVGVGTVAAGVSKARADHVTISGFEGGTGASPLTSLTHAGSPWEIGLAETQQTLVLNGLRGRIAVQVDGGLRTGRDVAIGALLGADEFGFATAPLIAAGCIMMRKCHLNTCPVGVATQDPVLRKRFTGQPEHVINYFFFVAEELREIMARLGFRTLNDMIGRVDKLDMRNAVDHWKAGGVDLSKLLYVAPARPGVAIWNSRAAGSRARQGARSPADRGGPAGARQRRAGAGRAADRQRQPHRGRHAVGRGRPAHRPYRPGRGHDLGEAFGHGRPELRRLPGARRVARTVGRRQRLCRQGPVGRPGRRAPAQGLHARSAGEHHRRQYRALRRDRRRSLFRRRRRRALRGAQLGRRCRRRGHRRPWLRIHDRRRRGRAGRHRAQLRSRHVGRRRLCLRSRGALRRTVQPVDGRARSGLGRRGRQGRSGAAAPAVAQRRRQRHGRHAALRRRAPAHPGRASSPAHRQRPGARASGGLGRGAEELHQGDAEGLQARAPAGARTRGGQGGRGGVINALCCPPFETRAARAPQGEVAG